MSKEAREAFVGEVAKDEKELNLAYATLLIVDELAGESEIPRYLTLLDEMAETVRAPIRAAGTALQAVQALNRYLFEDLGFAGNVANYYHPDNSFLNKVLESKTGIPISLSVVYLEVGWRLGLPLWGVGLPGHFIVAHGPPADPLFIDVFHQGQLLTDRECLALSRLPESNLERFRREYLKPITKQAILFRMLLNLKQIYLNWEDWEAAYRTVGLMLALRPDLPAEIRDRGLLAYRLNRVQEAIFNIQRYLFLAPESSDSEWLAEHLERMESDFLRLN